MEELDPAINDFMSCLDNSAPCGSFYVYSQNPPLSCLLLKRLKDGKKSVNRTMPTSAKTTSVTLLVSTAEILRKIYVGKGKHYETHHEAVNDIIVNHCKLKEVIDEQYHHLSFRAVGKEVFIVKDNAKGLDADIVVAYDAESKKNRLYCTLDKSTYCDHIGFAVTQPDILHMDDIEKVSRRELTG